LLIKHVRVQIRREALCGVAQRLKAPPRLPS